MLQGTASVRRQGAGGWMLAAGISFFLAFLSGCGGSTGPSSQSINLYCGQDQEYAEQILNDFRQATGIQVFVRADTEADKSVSLYEAIVREARHPRCDVFWNNEVLNTVRLARQGLLEPYQSPAAEPYPAWTKGPNRQWQAFAARARILIVNTARVPPGDRPQSILDLTQPRWKGKVAIAKPLFGTTATHAVCLFQALGKEKAEQFFHALKPKVAILPGNEDVAIAVAEGRYEVGFTDTDDAIIEVRHGRPVAIIYPDQNGMGTLFLPNTLALIKGGPNPEAARKLVDYLLSPEVETKLARGRSAQIPLNPQIQVKLPVETPATVKAMEVDFDQAVLLWDEVQTFLRNEFVQP